MLFKRKMNKFKIIEYFTDLRSKVDLYVELYNRDNLQNQELVDQVNVAREEWLKEIDDCEALNLSESKETEEVSEIFKRFCFLIEFH
jgi:hypothetical protein